MMVTCPECKNEFTCDIEKKGQIIECQFCGITLEVLNEPGEGGVDLDIVEEGK